jgi:hypothetical protein
MEQVRRGRRESRFDSMPVSLGVVAHLLQNMGRAAVPDLRLCRCASSHGPGDTVLLVASPHRRPGYGQCSGYPRQSPRILGWAMRRSPQSNRIEIVEAMNDGALNNGAWLAENCSECRAALPFPSSMTSAEQHNGRREAKVRLLRLSW